ncbi:hypothetical protein [Streptosporangium sp. NPDC087985]|uniref:hypothetical protein n=1 Tax=Streptosporangium sp. NPDC087985 TaxID=3366196 RepID=UPI00382B1FD2
MTAPEVGFTEGKVKALGSSIGEYVPGFKEKANKTRNNGLQWPKCGVVGIGLDLAHENTCGASADALDAAASALSSWKTALTQADQAYKTADEKSSIAEDTERKKTKSDDKDSGPAKPGAGARELPGSDPGGMPSGSGLDGGKLPGSGLGNMPSGSGLDGGKLPDSDLGNRTLPDLNHTGPDVPRMPEVPGMKDDLANSLNPNIPNTSNLDPGGVNDKLSSPDLGNLSNKDPRLTDLAGYDPNSLTTPQTKIPDPGTWSGNQGSQTGAGTTSGGATLPGGAGGGGGSSPLTGPRAAGMSGGSMFPPMMPPMGGGAGGNPGEDKETSSLLTGDESDWDADIDVAPPVIGQEQ